MPILLNLNAQVIFESKPTYPQETQSMSDQLWWAITLTTVYFITVPPSTNNNPVSLPSPTICLPISRNKSDPWACTILNVNLPFKRIDLGLQAVLDVIIMKIFIVVSVSVIIGCQQICKVVSLGRAVVTFRANLHWQSIVPGSTRLVPKSNLPKCCVHIHAACNMQQYKGLAQQLGVEQVNTPRAL